VLLEQGVEGFTLRECARRAGVSHGAPAHHFGDARGLLSEFSALSFERLDALMRAYRQRSEPDGYAQFAATGLAYVDFALANRARFQLMFRSDRLDYCNERLSVAGARVYAHLVETVTAMRPERSRGEMPREHIALAWSIAHGVATLMLDNRTFAELVGGRPEHAHAMMLDLLRRARPLFEAVAPGEAPKRAATRAVRRR
jgi:AcrR family transcriptional regulator